ncbi:hypothetical protein Pmani_013072 [Petrolisthes manimaculis]|uniref:Uncharacterized protein n=1 Tax=Petrolisthes manimaculis TaxID=1843537 RepID=A0AAE1UE08_9EUCA|nr:hypothetical protein Pmani_023839 [Petrolisthes manimaculis]KAK4315710.1 hypothetical protein Pmani_013072 [Petrolisthes manimaculis]
MKLIVFACLLAVAVARPQVDERYRSSQTVNSENINEGNGVFRYGFETDTGISVNAEGTPGVEGQSNIAGTYRFDLGNGQIMEVTYVADENGYRPQTRLTTN